MKKKEYERELTGKESAVCMLMAFVAIMLVGGNETLEPMGLAEWVRMVIGIVLALGTCIWQHKRMHQPIDEEDEHGE